MSALKIMIVEDNQINLDLIAQKLIEAGHKTIKVSDANKTIQLLEQEKPDVILLDLMMPEIDGIDLCKQIRQNKKHDDLKIIICSAKRYESDRRNADGAGADAYITKPFTSKSVETIERVINHEIKIKFWGVRGTLPVSNRRSTKYGGNTICVTATLPDETLIIFDAGTGIKFLSEDLMSKGLTRNKIKVFISHPHWDHINALPLFTPLYIPGNKIDIYGPSCQGRGIKDLVFSQMDDVHFPVTTQEMGADISYTNLSEGVVPGLTNFKMQTILLTHPGNCLGYKLEFGDKSICYLTDNELYFPDEESFAQEQYDALVAFTKDTDLLITDTTYSDETYKSKIHWGHSCVSRVADLARDSQCKTLAIFHHDPEQTDDDIDQKFEEAKNKLADCDTECIAPKEEDTLVISTNKKINK